MSKARREKKNPGKRRPRETRAEAAVRKSKGRPRRDGGTRARACALEAIARIDAGLRARDTIAGIFARDPSLDEAGREQAAGWVYSVLRRLRLIDHVLDAVSAGKTGRERLERLGPLRDRARLIASELIDGAVGVAEASGIIPEVDWETARAELLRLRAETPAGEPAGDDARAAVAARIALRWSLDDEVARRLVGALGALETDRIGRALDAPAAVIARANTLRTTREQLAARLRDESGIETEPTALAKDGLVLLGAARPFRTAAFAAGLFELQDEASQIVSEVVAPPPRGTVVDACAGAGGKTLHLGALLGNRGRLVAVDLPTPGARRLAELRRRARRAGLDNLEALEASADGPEPPALARLRGRADRVLVDAPCSGLGVLRRKPEGRRRNDAERLDRLPALQRTILERFAPLVAPGGRLVYATCTVLPEENERVVEGFLADHPDFELAPIKSYAGSERAHAIGDGTFLRLLPHVHGTDGFFAAVMRRRREPATSAPRAEGGP